MAHIVLTQTELIEELEQLAAQEGKPVSELLSEAVRQHLDTYRQKRIWAETEAWYRKGSAERLRYVGRFVAVRGGQVVDQDPDRLVLYHRIRERFGRKPVLIIEGGDQPMPIYGVGGARKPGMANGDEV
jgi:hypothetical protein